MNLSKSLALILIVLAIGCKSDKPAPEPISSKILKNFNKLAKESFIKNYDSYDLQPLRLIEKEDLKRSIEYYIDQNIGSIEVVDSFFIRNYYGEIDIKYSFVSNKSGEFYLVYLPHFHEPWLIDSLYSYDKSINMYYLLLKDSINYSIITLNSPMMDEFFNKEIFNPKRSTEEQIQQADHLLDKAFPYLFKGTAHRYDVIEELKSYPIKNSTYLMNVLNPIFKQEHTISSGNLKYRIASNFFGFVITNYSLDEFIPNKVKVTVYLIPKRKIPRILRM